MEQQKQDPQEPVFVSEDVGSAMRIAINPGIRCKQRRHAGENSGKDQRVRPEAADARNKENGTSLRP